MIALTLLYTFITFAIEDAPLKLIFEILAAFMAQLEIRIRVANVFYFGLLHNIGIILPKNFGEIFII